MPAVPFSMKGKCLLGFRSRESSGFELNLEGLQWNPPGLLYSWAGTVLCCASFKAIAPQICGTNFVCAFA